VKVVVGKEPLRGIFKWTSRSLFACAILLLCYCGFALVDAWIFQRRASQDLDRELIARPAAIHGSTPSPASAAPKPRPPAAADSLIGRLRIPRLLLSVVVVEGVGHTELRRAVGHIPGTALPGEPGNVGVAGHRDTFFRPLENLKLKDKIRISTPQGDFQYEVESLRIVNPDNVDVLAPSHENVLTLVTCYPFYFVGPAPRRWIVRARQVSPQTGSIVE
jgi:sortase A